MGVEFDECFWGIGVEMCVGVGGDDDDCGLWDGEDGYSIMLLVYMMKGGC